MPAPLDPAAFREILAAARSLSLLSDAEAGEVLALFEPTFPLCAALGLADTVHVHVKVDDVDALPAARLVAAGGAVENARFGYVKYTFSAGLNLIFSSIPVAEEDRVFGRPAAVKPFLDHVGLDLRGESDAVRAVFAEVPMEALRVGWAHAAQGGAAGPVFCCHVQVAAKHWVYPEGQDRRWTRPIEVAFGPLLVTAGASGCDLRPTDPRHAAPQPCSGPRQNEAR